MTQLFSPARRPSYNGALERSNGVLKTYTHRHALQEGHPLRWTSDDLDHAMQLANTISRPWGHEDRRPKRPGRRASRSAFSNERTFMVRSPATVQKPAKTWGLMSTRGSSPAATGHDATVWPSAVCCKTWAT